MNSYQRFLIRMRGYARGSGAQPIEPRYQTQPDYISGYQDGQRRKREYSAQLADAMGVNLHTILANALR